MQQPKPNDFGLNESIVSKFLKRKKYFPIYSLLISTIIFSIPFFLLHFRNVADVFVISYVLISPYILFTYYLNDKILSNLFSSKNLKNYFIAEKEYTAYLEEEKKRIQRLNENYWYSLSGYIFEEEVTEIIKQFGINAKKTKGSNDGGIDIILYDEHDKTDTYVQCKAYKKKLSPSTARELFGVMKADNVECGLIVCLGGFSNETINFAQDKNIRLWDINTLITLNQYLGNNIVDTYTNEKNIDLIEKRISSNMKYENESNFKNNLITKPPHLL